MGWNFLYLKSLLVSVSSSSYSIPPDRPLSHSRYLPCEVAGGIYPPPCLLERQQVTVHHLLVPVLIPLYCRQFALHTVTGNRRESRRKATDKLRPSTFICEVDGRGFSVPSVHRNCCRLPHPIMTHCQVAWGRAVVTSSPGVMPSPTAAGMAFPFSCQARRE